MMAARPYVFVLSNEPDAAAHGGHCDEECQDLTEPFGRQLALDCLGLELVPMGRLALGHRDNPLRAAVECLVVLGEGTRGWKRPLKGRANGDFLDAPRTFGCPSGLSAIGPCRRH